ncbi:MAG: DUF2793 domain-containing protein [Hyphomonadaceae bacterium]
MTDQTTNLHLPYLQSGQAQKHVTVNESLTLLDALVQLSAVSATTAEQPSTPADGAVYLLPPGKTGAAWGGMADGALAHHRAGAWSAIAPHEGFVCWVSDADKLLIYSGSAWLETGNALTRAIATLSADGFVARTSASAAAARALTAGAGISISNGNGVAGNPTIAIDTAASLTWTGAMVLQGGFTSGNWITAQHADARIYLNDTTPSSGRSFLLRSSGSTLQFHDISAGAERARFDASGHFVPGADNTYNLGSASLRLKEVFAATGAINTSDAREKTTLQPVPESVKRAVRKVIAGAGVFQRLDAVAAKGADRARLHVGVTAQAVRDAFLAEGEDPERWALFCADAVPSSEAPDGSETRLGLRTDQLLMLALHAMG